MGRQGMGRHMHLRRQCGGGGRRRRCRCRRHRLWLRLDPDDEPQARRPRLHLEVRLLHEVELRLWLRLLHVKPLVLLQVQPLVRLRQQVREEQGLDVCHGRGDGGGLARSQERGRPGGAGAGRGRGGRGGGLLQAQGGAQTGGVPGATLLALLLAPLGRPRQGGRLGLLPRLLGLGLGRHLVIVVLNVTEEKLCHRRSCRTRAQTRMFTEGPVHTFT